MKKEKKSCLTCNKLLTNYQSKFCSDKCKNKKYRQSKTYKEYRKKYLQSQKYKDYLKRYRQTEEYKQSIKKYRKSEKGKIAIKKVFKKYRKSEKGKALAKRHYLKRKKSGQMIEYALKYEKKQRKSNPVFKLKQDLRHRLFNFLKSKKIKKSNKTFDLVGCTPEYLRKYLEKRFKAGMNWNNHSINGWHVDHIIPLNSAKNLKDLKKLMNYKNLQPMWAKDNLIKSDK